jgi:hypothetical protein
MADPTALARLAVIQGQLASSDALATTIASELASVTTLATSAAALSATLTARAATLNALNVEAAGIVRDQGLDERQWPRAGGTAGAQWQAALTLAAIKAAGTGSPLATDAGAKALLHALGLRLQFEA